MTKRKTHEEFVAEVYDLVGEKFTVLGKYKNNKIKIDIKHNICGETNFVTPALFLTKQPCPTCNGGVKKTHDDFIKKVFELEGNKYEVLGTYVRSGDKLKMRHNDCGHEWDITPNNFTVQNRRCPECFEKIRGQKKLKKNDSYLKEVFDLVGEEYSVLSKYKGAGKKVIMKHNTCDYVYDVLPSNFSQGKRCPQCSGCVKRTQEKFIEEVFEVYGNEYTVIGQYENNRKNVEVIHNKECGHKWKVNPLQFLKGHCCPKCKSSKGEKAILKWLQSNNIKFIHQFPIEKCRNILALPFDFAVFLNDNSFILIEYQGEPHYKPIKIMGGEKGFKKRKENDAIKKKFCEDNNIPLFEIPYWDLNNIDQILNDQLLPLNLMKQENPAPLDKLEQKQLEFSF